MALLYLDLRLLHGEDISLGPAKKTQFALYVLII